mgnify:CR=1 FL=1
MTLREKQLPISTAYVLLMGGGACLVRNAWYQMESTFAKLDFLGEIKATAMGSEVMTKRALEVKTKYKAALVTAAIEAYRAQHPYGIDYQELEEIRRQTYRSFQPKKPIQENLKQAAVPEPAPIPQPAHIPEAAENDMMDQAIALYGLDEDDESEL